MPAIQHVVPNHDSGTASVRLRQGTLRDSPSAGRDWDMASIGPYEVICPACGDDPSLNYADVPPQIQAIRGNHASIEAARTALAEHTGLQL